MSQSINRLILVICDYATRYPKAYPFREVGIPKEVLTDQEPNFMSHTLFQVCQCLGIKSVKTTPYPS